MRVTQCAAVASGCGVEQTRLGERRETKRTHAARAEVQELAPVEQMIRIE